MLCVHVDVESGTSDFEHVVIDFSGQLLQEGGETVLVVGGPFSVSKSFKDYVQLEIRAAQIEDRTDVYGRFQQPG